MKVISAVALGFIGLTILYALHKEEVIDSSPLMISAFSFCFAVAIGSVWEIFEFGMDHVFGFTLSSSDTIQNLIANSIGALFVSTAGYIYLRSGKEGLVSQFVLNLMRKRKREKKNEEKGLIDLINKGERHDLEFKSTLRKNLYTDQFDKKVEHSALKTIVAYLNSGGGTLLIGVSDEGEITGMTRDAFPDNDKLGLYFTNIIKEGIGAEYLPFIKHEIVPVDGKHVLKVECLPSDRHVFLKNGKSEEFYVRNGPSSARLDGSSLVEYIRRRFETGQK